MPASRTRSAKISRTGAPAGQAMCSGFSAVPSGSATADGTARPAPTQRSPLSRSSRAQSSTTSPMTWAGSAVTVAQLGVVATSRPPSPTSAARNPSACTWAAMATGPDSRMASRCEGRPCEPHGGARPGVDPDQSERLQFRGDRTGRRPGDAEFGGEDGAGGRASGVDQFQRGSERAAAPLQLCPGGGHLAVHGGESPMIRGCCRRPGRAHLPRAPVAGSRLARVVRTPLC